MFYQTFAKHVYLSALGAFLEVGIIHFIYIYIYTYVNVHNIHIQIMVVPNSQLNGSTGACDTHIIYLYFMRDITSHLEPMDKYHS